LLQKKKYYSQSKALEAMQKYCALQDRCQQDVRSKLIAGGIYGEEIEEILAELISEGFLDEARYARALVSGKYKINLWGRQKIKMALKVKDLSSYCIQDGLSIIDEQIYRENARKLITNKLKSIDHSLGVFEKRNKILSFMHGKGYEHELVHDLLDTVLQKEN